MIKVIPFIQTTGSERFKNFLTVPFTIDMLAPVFGDKSCDTIFDGWQGKSMGNWHKFQNDGEIILEFYSDCYVIKKPVSKLKIGVYQLPLPRTINDFINDMDRFNISIYWSKWIDINFEPKEYLNEEGIANYFIDLLSKMGKSHEL